MYLCTHLLVKFVRRNGCIFLEGQLIGTPNYRQILLEAADLPSLEVQAEGQMCLAA